MGIVEGKAVEIALVLLVSFFAGWVVNWLADSAPEPLPMGVTWRWPLLQLCWPITSMFGAQLEPPAGCQLRLGRTLTTWSIALLLGGLAYVRAGFTLEALIIALYAWFFLAVAVIDLEHRRVLNRMLLPALGGMLLISLVFHTPAPVSALIGGAIGFTIFLVLALLRPGGMGMGDVKLAGIIGLATGFSGVIVALFVGILAGGVAALALFVASRFDRKATMAYAPYLVIGAWTALYFGVDLWNYYF